MGEAGLRGRGQKGGRELDWPPQLIDRSCIESCAGLERVFAPPTLSFNNLNICTFIYAWRLFMLVENRRKDLMTSFTQFLYLCKIFSLWSRYSPNSLFFLLSNSFIFTDLFYNKNIWRHHMCEIWSLSIFCYFMWDKYNLLFNIQTF